jgi:two-component system, OmpR family, KDP operon response regulator KdpE
VTDPRPLVLVIEDEPQMRRFVHIALESHDYRVVEATSAADGIRQASMSRPDVVVLDLGLPDGDGLDVTRRIREWTTVPIVVVSARRQEDTKVVALDEGADDYLTKPFGAAELLARIRVALRHATRSRAAPDAVVNIGDDVRVDLARRLVFVRGEEMHLTPIEYKLLVELVRHAGVVVTQRHLLAHVWGPGYANQTGYLRVYMTQLRRKLERDSARPRYLLTEPGVGYRLKADV